MSDHERGAYTPPTSDAPLAFDARQPVRGARPIPFTLILSVLVLAALVAAIFVFYRSGVREAGQAPELVGSPVAGMKAPAPPEAQPVDPAAGLQVYRAEADPAPAEPRFTPPPEQPQPRPTTPVVVTEAPLPPPAAQQPPAIRPALPAAPPAQKAAPPAKAEPPPAKAPPKAEPAPTAGAGGGVAVQVGAVSSPALADRTWSEAVAAAPGLAAGKGKSVEKIERNGTVLYRTAVTGFASRADAQAFCERLKAAGRNCFVR